MRDLHTCVDGSENTHILVLPSATTLEDVESIKVYPNFINPHKSVMKSRSVPASRHSPTDSMTKRGDPSPLTDLAQPPRLALASPSPHPLPSVLDWKFLQFNHFADVANLNLPHFFSQSKQDEDRRLRALRESAKRWTQRPANVCR